MRIRIILLLLVALVANNVFGQSQVDSLLNLLPYYENKVKEDKTYVNERAELIVIYGQLGVLDGEKWIGKTGNLLKQLYKLDPKQGEMLKQFIDRATVIISNKKERDAHTVDLGLSVRWADCNLGAAKPTDSGNGYSWGEIVTKDSYTRDNYSLTGTVMNDIAGNEAYDAATAILGPDWRLPTPDEMKELIEKCHWQREEIGKIEGCRAIGPNGNSIFLPFLNNEYFDNKGYYWSSGTTNDIEDNTSIGIIVSFRTHELHNGLYRHIPAAIRPVRTN